MKNNINVFKDSFIMEIKRRLFEENVPRLKKCVGELTDSQIWYRPNLHSNSVGNLVLHLCGNVRQWILAGVGGEKDVRERQKEFDEKGPISTEKMLKDLDDLIMAVDQVLDQIEASALLKMYDVQGYKESGLSILIHVTEHFSYHIGQMTYIVKMLKDMDMGYYEGQDLNAK